MRNSLRCVTECGVWEGARGHVQGRLVSSFERGSLLPFHLSPPRAIFTTILPEQSDPHESAAVLPQVNREEVDVA